MGVVFPCSEPILFFYYDYHSVAIFYFLMSLKKTLTFPSLSNPVLQYHEYSVKWRMNTACLCHRYTEVTSLTQRAVFAQQII